MRILLAEDESTISRLIRAVLVSGGHEVTGVRSVAEATAALDAGSYDLVLLDQDLAGGVAREVIDTINGPGRLHPPLLLLTGERHFSHEDALAGAVEGVLWKPFEIDDLERLVNRFSA